MDQNTNDIQQEIPVVSSDWAYPKVYQMTVTFNDDTVIEGYAQKSSISDEVWVLPSDPRLGYMELIQIFTNPEKTSVMVANMSETEHNRYEGYTRLANIMAQTDGKFNICMTKPVT